MIYEADFIESLVKYTDKETIKKIIIDLELEWDTELLGIFADNGLLDIAFELCNKDDIIEFLSEGNHNICEDKANGLFPTSMNLQPGILEGINNGATIYNIFYNLGEDIDKSDNYAGFASCLNTEEIDTDIIEFLGGIEIVTKLLDTYGSLNGWYKDTSSSDSQSWYYRDKYQVQGYFDNIVVHTVEQFCNEFSLNTTEVLNFLKNEFNKNYDLDDFLYDEFTALAVEYDIMYKL